jgi:hypothetical protein
MIGNRVLTAMNARIPLLLLMGCFLLSQQSFSQIYFQFEQANTVDVKKYGLGETIDFKTKKYEGWQRGTISNILPEDGALIFPDRITYVDDITYFKFKRPVVNTLGTTVQYFGASWLVMGGAIEGLNRIGALETQYEFGYCDHRSEFVCRRLSDSESLGNSCQKD